MVLDEPQGIFLPEIVDPARVSGSGVELAVCPGKGLPLEAMSRELFGEALATTPELGRYRGAMAACCTDREVLAAAASGGVMTAIGLHLLATGAVDGVTSADFEPTPHGPRTVVRVSRTREELLACQGSKYCPTTTNTLIRSCRRAGGRYLFLGTPCQVGALRLAVRAEPDLAALFPFTMGNFCGGYRDFRDLDAIIRETGLVPGAVRQFRFRGGGWPGSMLAVTEDGQRGEQPYPDYAQKQRFGKPKRCVLCIDGTALLADFACGDAWLDRFEAKGQDHGWSIIVVRSPAAEAIVAEMVARGLLRTEPVSHEDILYSQRFNLDSKINRQRQRRRVYRLMGQTLPQYDVPLPAGGTTLRRELKTYLGKSRLGQWLRRRRGKR